MSKIIIDHREDKKILKELVKKGLEVKTEQLGLADFIIETKNQAGEIKMIAIERKVQNDFINSIIDKRLLRQLFDIKKNYELPLLIIEGSKNIYSIRNFHPNAIRGMLATIAIDFQIPIVYTKNYRDTASFLSIIAGRLEKSRSEISLIKKRKPLTKREQQEFIVESLPGIGPKTSKSLLKKFRSIKEIINAEEKELKQVEKIGPKKAKALKTIIDHNYEN